MVKLKTSKEKETKHLFPFYLKMLSSLVYHKKQRVQIKIEKKDQSNLLLTNKYFVKFTIIPNDVFTMKDLVHSSPSQNKGLFTNTIVFLKANKIVKPALLSIYNKIKTENVLFHKDSFYTVLHIYLLTLL